MVAGLLLLAFALAPAPGPLCNVHAMRDDGMPGEPITGAAETAERLVGGTPVIARAVAVRELPARGLQMPAMVFRVVEVLKGEQVPDTLRFSGYASDADDYNGGPVPYTGRRRGDVGGSCYAYNYKPGAEYLLFLGRFRWGLTPYHSVFSPTNEQLHGPDDPWLRWVRDRIPAGARARTAGDATARTPAPPARARPASAQPRPIAKRFCIVENGELREVPIRVDPTSGDSLYDGRPVREAFPVTSEYGRSAAWYVHDEWLFFRGRPYWKFGKPRWLKTSDLVRIGKSRQGLSVFAGRAGRTPPKEIYEFVYVADRPGCQFQPYETELNGGGQ